VHPLSRRGCRSQLGRTEAWRDELWRLTASLVAEVPGFCYLEPLRHVPHITDLEGREAATFGPVPAGRRLPLLALPLGAAVE
jgi:hypothetical protein